MRRILILLIGVFFIFSVRPSAGQGMCPGFPGVAMGTPEDYLVQDIFEIDNTQERIEVLDEFVQENPDSEFIPCAHEHYTLNYLELQNMDKVIEHGEKAAESGKAGVLLYVNLAKGHVAKGGPADRGTEVSLTGAEKVIERWDNPPEAEEDPEGFQAQLQENRRYLEYAFFQLLPRIQDVSKRIQYLDQFAERFPDTQLISQANLQYFIAYKMANNPEKVIEYGEKAIAASPDDVITLNLVAEDFAQRGQQLTEVPKYVQKVLELAPNLPKPGHVSEEAWAQNKNVQLGMAHETLGFLSLRQKQWASATKEFNTALGLLEGGDPFRHARALFRLGYTYAAMPATKANLRQAEKVLAQAAALNSPFQGEAQNLLGKVRQAARK
jgi:tetratricopeptide (TPR) repeat protein